MTIEPSREYHTLFKKKKKRKSLTQVYYFLHTSFRTDEEVGMAKNNNRWKMYECRKTIIYYLLCSLVRILFYLIDSVLYAH